MGILDAVTDKMQERTSYHGSANFDASGDAVYSALVHFLEKTSIVYKIKSKSKYSGGGTVDWSCVPFAGIHVHAGSISARVDSVLQPDGKSASVLYLSLNIQSGFHKNAAEKDFNYYIEKTKTALGK